MRKVYRDNVNSDYWDKRWEAVGVDRTEFNNMDMYPIKYAELVTGNSTRILEAGCGTGRVYFHYKSRGKNIEGIEYSKVAVENILKEDPDAKVIQGSVTDLPYEKDSFDVVLAFGLFHNLKTEDELETAFSETSRVLKKKGKLVASVRCDSLENILIEKIMKWRSPQREFNKFHKCQFDLKDLTYYFEKSHLKIVKSFYDRNVSFLFKFNMFRAKNMKQDIFDEANARSEGFRLNSLGEALDNFLHRTFPKQFSNILVVIGEKT